jgi:putative SOS response-associated peptidase YedK
MCCRYVLLKEDAKSLLEKLGVLLEAGATTSTRYNISPGGRIPAIRNKVERVVPNALSETASRHP